MLIWYFSLGKTPNVHGRLSNIFRLTGLAHRTVENLFFSSCDGIGFLEMDMDDITVNFSQNLKAKFT